MFLLQVTKRDGDLFNFQKNTENSTIFPISPQTLSSHIVQDTEILAVIYFISCSILALS
jgi:hypothetical protein